MRENIRKWCALGALTAVALVYPGCKSDSREPAAESSDSLMKADSEEGTGGSGRMGTQTGDAAMATDAGTGGAGSESLGTTGQGVSGSDSEQRESTGYSNSGGLPAQ
jgi:hypothetical protein